MMYCHSWTSGAKTLLDPKLKYQLPLVRQFNLTVLKTIGPFFIMKLAGTVQYMVVNWLTRALMAGTYCNCTHNTVARVFSLFAP